MPKGKVKPCPGEIFYEGEVFRVELAVTTTGRCPAQEFLRGLPSGEKARISALIKRLADQGSIKNREQFKKIEDTDFFEFKSFQIRMPCYFRKDRIVVITHGFRKKGHRIRKSEINRMNIIREEYEGIRKKN